MKFTVNLPPLPEGVEVQEIILVAPTGDAWGGEFRLTLALDTDHTLVDQRGSDVGTWE